MQAKEWKPVLGQAYFEPEKYSPLFSQQFTEEINNSLEIHSSQGREEIAKALLYAARSYEIEKQNLHHFYKSPSDRKKQITQLNTGLKKTLRSLREMRTEEGKSAFVEIMMQFKMLFQIEQPDIIETSLTHPTEIKLSELDRLENFFQLFINSCDSALDTIKTSHKMTSTQPLEKGLIPIRRVWLKYKSPVTFTEGNPDYADYSKAAKICYKIMQEIDPNIEIVTIAGVIKRMKNKDLHL